MLDTVRSRCSSFVLEEPADTADPVIRETAARLWEAFSEEAPYYRRKECLAQVLDSKENQKEQALALLNSFELFAADAAARSGSAAGLAAAELAGTARRQIKQGQSVPYTLKQMCLGLKARR